jgi:pimeloyl-ACP methyl ester carboxylesterase
MFGHSFGSRVIGEIYRQAPNLVRALVYVDGSIQRADPATAARDFERQVEKAGFETIIDALYDDFFVASSPDDVRRTILSRRSKIDAAFHLPLFVDTIAWDAAHGVEVIRSINVPCLVIQSSSVGANMKRTAIEPGIDTPLMALIRQEVPSARIEIVRGVGHFPMLEAPARTNAIIKEFLAGI